MSIRRDSISQIWIGNIPYDASEQDLRSLLGSVGQILNLRIRYDKESGQSKGFAFCEFKDQESCAVAIRTLNEREWRGRTIRIDWATSEMRQRYQSEIAKQKPQPFLLQPSAGPSHTQSSSPNQQEDDMSLPVDRSVVSEVLNIVQTMDLSLLFYLFRQFQHFLTHSPDLSRAFLNENPQLVYALLHGLVVIGMLDEDFSVLTNAQMRVASKFNVEQEELKNSVNAQLFNFTDASAFPSQSAQSDPQMSTPYPPSPGSWQEAPIDNDQSPGEREDPEVLAFKEHGDREFRDSYRDPVPVGPQNPPEYRHSWGSAEPGSYHAFPESKPNAEPLYTEPPPLTTASWPIEHGNPPPPVQEDQFEIDAKFLDEIINNETFLNQLLTSSPERETGWSVEERQQVSAIQAALLARGYVLRRKRN